MPALRLAEKAIATASVAAMPRTITAAESAVEMSKTVRIIVLATRPPSANTSPFAKLISCRMP